MTRERLKAESTAIVEMDKKFSSSIEIRMAQIIERQDQYIDALTKFIEEITLSGGKYKHLNGDIIIADAYKILGG